MFEIYKAVLGRKTFIVSDVYPAHFNATREYARKYFKVAVSKIEVKRGWIIDDDLFLEDPHLVESKKRWVAYLK